MKLQFYTQSDKPFPEDDALQRATIFRWSDEKEKLEFEKSDNLFPIFFEYYDYETLEGRMSAAIFDSIATICREKNSEAALICNYEDFLTTLKWTDKNEMKVETLVTENRGLLLYAAIGKNNCVLLVSYDISDD